MTVKDLVAFLKKADPKAEVVLSKDGEGNAFSPLNLVQDAHYVPNKRMPWAIDYWSNEPEEGSRKCVLLWPSN